jgi:hypothetical protein
MDLYSRKTWRSKSLRPRESILAGEWRHSYKLSKAGERLCDALKSMGLREEF